MKVLITGAAGFLGYHLSQKYITLGWEVYGLDNLSTGSIQNIKFLNESRYFNFIKHDVREPYRFKVDLILNFACPASPLQYQSDPINTLETNVLGTINALKLAKELRIPIVQSSTSEIYGSPEKSPQVESYWGNVNPIGVRACYDEGKRVAETFCFDYKRQHNVDVRVVRIFNTYGPNMKIEDGRVISNFIVQALGHKPLTIFGDGKQTRSFCYVSDLVKAIHKIGDAKSNFDTPINIGNPLEHTMLEIADIIIQLTGSSSQLKFERLPDDDPLQRRPDITLAKKKLNWQPKISLKDGLVNTIEFFKKII